MIKRGKYRRYSGRSRGYAYFSIMLLLLCLVFLHTGQAYAYDAEVTPEELAEMAPKNQWLAVAFFMAAFAVKSFVFVIPIPLLYIAVGLIFEPVAAFVVNFFGMLVCTTVPYWIGRFSGSGLFSRLVKKYPKLQILDNFQHDNEWFFSFMVRAVGFLPCDAVSLVLGASRLGFWKYLSGTAVGMLPGFIATTLVGITITDPRSPQFIFSVILAIAVSLGSFLFWRLYQKLRMPPSYKSAISAGLDNQREERRKR